MEPKIQKGANWYGRQDEDDRVPRKAVIPECVWRKAPARGLEGLKGRYRIAQVLSPWVEGMSGAHPNPASLGSRVYRDACTSSTIAYTLTKKIYSRPKVPGQISAYGRS